MSRCCHQPPPSAAQVQFVSCWKEASLDEDGEPLSFDISTFYWKKLFFSIEFRILLGTRATIRNCNARALYSSWRDYCDPPPGGSWLVQVILII